MYVRNATVEINEHTLNCKYLYNNLSPTEQQGAGCARHNTPSVIDWLCIFAIYLQDFRCTKITQPS